MAAKQVSLQFLEAGKCITQVNINFSFSQTTKLSHIPTLRMPASLNFVLATRLINATSTLAANLILLK